MISIPLTDNEFTVFQKLIYKEVGIVLNEQKKVLVQSRLLKRLMYYQLESYTEYLRLVQINPQEKIEMLNLITTNETYFFRETKHFDFLIDNIIPNIVSNEVFRVWSAAASVGAEAYSIAMVLDEYCYVNKWEVIASDVNSEVLKIARIGLYPLKWIDKIPEKYLKRYCLKGKGINEGKFLIDRCLLDHVRFHQANLLDPNTDLGEFNVIFLRNVLLYFDTETKQKVLDNVLRRLRKGGYLFISHTENLLGLENRSLEQIQTSIYRKKSTV